MKWVKIIFLALALLLAGYWIGYEVGFRDRPPKSDKETLLVQLSLNAGNYTSLKKGNIGLVEDNLRACILGEVKACDLYRSEDPTFNTSNESLKLWEGKGRVIAQEEEEIMQTNSVPVDTK